MNPHTVTVWDGDYRYVTTNLRVIVETYPEDWRAFLNRYMLEQAEEKHIKRETAKFIISRGIADEFVRHRVFSFSMESTRYVNYGKFGMEFIIPQWVKESPEFGEEWEWAMVTQEHAYQHFLNKGIQAQNSRGVLPLDIRTMLIMTGDTNQWKDFFDKRVFEVTGKPHPDAKYIAEEWHSIIRDGEV